MSKNRNEIPDTKNIGRFKMPRKTHKSSNITGHLFLNMCVPKNKKKHEHHICSKIVSQTISILLRPQRIQQRSPKSKNNTSPITITLVSANICYLPTDASLLIGQQKPGFL
jgi:hypothetical protein